jgi:hypothetical protein
MIVMMLSILAGCAALAHAKEADPTRTLAVRLLEPLELATCEGAAQRSTPVVFRNDTPCIEVRAELVHISKPHSVRFLWYEPSGGLYAGTPLEWSFQPVPQATGYHGTARLRHRLGVHAEEAALHVGRWTVAMRLDDAHLAETHFWIERQHVPHSEALALGKKLYFDLSYREAIDVLGSLLDALQSPALQAEARWWMALAEAALGQSESAEQLLADLLDVEPGWTISSAEARTAGGEELRVRLDQLRGRLHPDLYVKNIDVPRVELSRPEPPPVLARPWPLWKKLLVYGAAPVAVGAGTFLLARGGSSGPEPLELSARIVESGADPRFECVPLAGTGSVSRTFEATIRGGSGSYGVEWNFNRAGGGASVTPARASDVTRQQVTYRIDSIGALGSYLATVEVRDANAPGSPPVRDSLNLLITFPANCAP